MVSLFSLVPHSPKNSLQSQYQSGKKKCGQQLKVVLLINSAKKLLTASWLHSQTTIQWPLQGSSTNRDRYSCTEHFQPLYPETWITAFCIPRGNFELFYLSKCSTSTHLGQSIFFWGHTLSKCPPLWGKKFSVKLPRTKWFPLLRFALCLILSWLWFHQKPWTKQCGKAASRRPSQEN